MRILFVLFFISSVGQAKVFFDQDSHQALVVLNSLGQDPADEQLGYDLQSPKIDEVKAYECTAISREDLVSAALSDSRKCQYFGSLSLKTLGWRLKKLQALLPPVALESLDGQAVSMVQLQVLQNQIALQQRPAEFRESLKNDSAQTIFARYQIMGAPFFDGNLFELPRFVDADIVTSSPSEIAEFKAEFELLKLSGFSMGNGRGETSGMREIQNFSKDPHFKKAQPVFELRISFAVNDCDVDVVAGDYLGSIGETRGPSGDGLFHDEVAADNVSASFEIEKFGPLPACTRPRKRILSTPWMKVKIVNNYFFVDHPATAHYEERGFHWERRSAKK